MKLTHLCEKLHSLEHQMYQLLTLKSTADLSTSWGRTETRNPIHPFIVQDF